MVLPGDPKPGFKARTAGNPNYAFYTVAGRYVVLSFLGSAAQAGARQVVAHIGRRKEMFDDSRLCFFGVSCEAPPVSSGERYAFLPFFYDEAAARQRQQNLHSLTGQVFDHGKGESEYAEPGQ